FAEQNALQIARLQGIDLYPMVIVPYCDPVTGNLYPGSVEREVPAIENDLAARCASRSVHHLDEKTHLDVFAVGQLFRQGRVSANRFKGRFVRQRKNEGELIGVNVQRQRRSSLGKAP